MPKNLRFDARRGTSVPYDSPPNEWVSVEERLPMKERSTMFEPMAMSPSPSEKRKEKTTKSTTKIVTKLCQCGRIMENVPQQRVLCEVCRKEQEKQKLEAHRSPYVQDTARRASRPRAKSQPYKSIEQCVREAKALGISYGQFVARRLDRM